MVSLPPEKLEMLRRQVCWSRGYRALITAARVLSWFERVLQTINWRTVTITEKAPARTFSVIVKSDCETDGSSAALVLS